MACPIFVKAASVVLILSKYNVQSQYICIHNDIHNGTPLNRLLVITDSFLCP